MSDTGVSKLGIGSYVIVSYASMSKLGVGSYAVVSTTGASQFMPVQAWWIVEKRMKNEVVMMSCRCHQKSSE
jgi:hypothetical protein